MGKPGSLLAQDGAPLAGAKVSGGLPLPLCYKPFDLLHHCFLGRAAAASHTGGLRGGPVLIKMLGGNEFCRRAPPLAGAKVSGGLPLPLRHKCLNLLDLFHNCNLRRAAVDFSPVDAVLQGHGLIHALVEQLGDGPEVPECQGVQGFVVLDAQIDQPAHDHISLPEGHPLSSPGSRRSRWR